MYKLSKEIKKRQVQKTIKLVVFGLIIIALVVIIVLLVRNFTISRATNYVPKTVTQQSSFFAEPKELSAKPLLMRTLSYSATVKKNFFKDNLSSFHSSFWSYDQIQKNRGYNIRLICKKLNNKVINSGGVFSYNKLVGPRTKKAGFKAAYEYANGEIVMGFGGGACQVSSTLYNTCLLYTSPSPRDS